MGICRSLYHSFNFVNMRFVVKVIFFPIKFYKKIYFHGNFITKFHFFFLLSYIFPWINKFLLTESYCLPRLIKQENCRSGHCILHGFYALNTRSIKILRRSAVKVVSRKLTAKKIAPAVRVRVWVWVRAIFLG